MTMVTRIQCVLTAVVAVLVAVRAGAAATVFDDPQALRLPVTDARLAVHGLGWWQENSPALIRLPLRSKAEFPPAVWRLAQTPAGVRIRFATDSAVVGVLAEHPRVSLVPHVTWLGQAGVDLYVDGAFRGSAAPEADGKMAREWSTGKTAARREISIYLPYGRPLAIQAIVLASGATIWPARPYAVAKPVVYYGSSITQGSAAANPGGTYLALLSRWLDADFVNLGFSGNGKGEPALARAVAEIDASCFVVDYWANPNPPEFRATLPGFIDTLRKKHPTTPILVTGPYYNPSEDVPGDAGRYQIEKRAFAREFVAARRASGDRHLVWVDGLEMLSREQADGLVDGRHANSMGFYFCARGLEPYLRAALGLPPGPAMRKAR